MNNIKYYLALERRLGDYVLIDISKLDIARTNVENDIAAIDSFTCHYSESEIKESIIRSNMASNYIDGNLKVISDAKHNLRILSKVEYNVIMDIQNNNEVIDREFKNKIFGAYKKCVEHTFSDKEFIKRLLDDFKEILNTDDKDSMFRKIGELPYRKGRSIYFYIYDEYKRKLEASKRILEKTSDND